MNVEDIMQRDVVTVTPETPIEVVLSLLREQGLPGVPVVNDAGRCVGIVTEADLVISEDEQDLHLPHHVDLFGAIIWLEPFKHFEERLQKAMASHVEDMMTRDPVTVAPDAPAQEAARLIVSSGHNRLPVVEHGRFVGLVTRVDVLEALARE
jgi:CBS domain-containing protein